MDKFLNQETPAKVMCLLAAAMVSMSFLFSVSYTEASFTQSAKSLPDPFAPQKVVAVIDQTANSYSSFMMDFSQPAREAVSWHMEQFALLIDDSSEDVVRLLGLNSLVAPQEWQAQPQVAGAIIRPALREQPVEVLEDP